MVHRLAQKCNLRVVINTSYDKCRDKSTKLVETDVSNLPQDRRGSENGGGVLVSSPPNVHSLRCNWNIPDKLECITVMVQNVFVTTVYRRPNLGSPLFIEMLAEHLKRIPCGDPSVVVGDFNEDLLSSSTNHKILNLMSTLGY